MVCGKITREHMETVCFECARKLPYIRGMRCAICSKAVSNDIGVCNENMPQVLENLKRFAGAQGGICYMSKPYFDSYVTDPEKALKRFTTVAATGHHSIAGHSQVALLFEGVPKIIAMFLNNLNDYETSEKSGRYTVMTGNYDLEMEIYHKWCRKLNDKIKEYYGTFIDEKTVDKLFMGLMVIIILINVYNIYKFM